MEIIVDLSALRKAKLYVNEYMLLYYAYCRYKKVNKTYTDMYGFCSDTYPLLLKLYEKNYVNIDSNRLATITQKGIDFFEKDSDLFKEFFEAFPHKTPGGRYLRPGTIDTVAGRKIRKKWERHFQGKVAKAKSAILALKAEIKHRQRNGSLEFMNNMETWINKGNYEVYAHLIEEDKQIDTKQKEDFV